MVDYCLIVQDLQHVYQPLDIPVPVENLSTSKILHMDDITGPVLSYVCHELLHGSDASNAVVDTFCDKLNIAVVAVIQQLKLEGASQTDVKCIVDVLNIDILPSVSQYRSACKLVDHAYVVNTPRTTKHSLNLALDALDSTKKKLKVSRQVTRRMKAKIDTFAKLADSLKREKLLSEDGCSSLLSPFSPSAASLIMRCLNSSNSGSYPPELRAFALSLQFHSNKAYEFVRQTFNNCLPHPKTLASWYKSVDGNPGFHDEVFEALRDMVNKRGGQKVVCAMMMDEVAIRKQVDWDGKQFVGYVDIGMGTWGGSDLLVAKEALVMMVVCLTERWKIPIAYFLIDGLNGKERAKLVRLALEKLYAVGIDIVSLTFDGCSANCAMTASLGANLDLDNFCHSFQHPSDSDRLVFIFLDACHMLKLMRNLLADKKVLVDSEGQLIKWNFVEELQKVQHGEGLRAGNKLTDRHIQWMRQKMKVKLAAQTLSSSVATAMLFCLNELKLPQFNGCEATAKFIFTVDRLFDLLNSRNPMAHGYKAPMMLKNETFWRPFVVDAQHYLYGLRLLDLQPVRLSLRKTTIVGFILSSSSAVCLFDILVKRDKVLKYLLTYKMSQDHLELFFSAVRSRGGWNNNPSVVHFKAAWQRLLSHQQIKDVSTGNCVAQSTCHILTVSSRIEKHSPVDVTTVASIRSSDTDIELPLTSFSDHDDYFRNVIAGNLSMYVENVVVYIAGFVVRSLRKRVMCNICIAVLSHVTQDTQCARRDFALIDCKDHGGLIHPSDDVISLCKASESCFRSNMGPNDKPLLTPNLKRMLVSDVLSSFVGSDIFSELDEHSFDCELLRDHRTSLMKQVIETFITIRLYHQGKSFTRSLHPENVRSTLNKTVIFKGQ